MINLWYDENAYDYMQGKNVRTFEGATEFKKTKDIKDLYLNNWIVICYYVINKF